MQTFIDYRTCFKMIGQKGLFVVLWINNISDDVASTAEALHKKTSSKVLINSVVSKALKTRSEFDKDACYRPLFVVYFLTTSWQNH